MRYEIKLIMICFTFFILYSCSDSSESSSLVSNVGSVTDTTDVTVNNDESTKIEALPEIVLLESIDLYSSRTSFLVGESVELIAIGHFSNGSVSEITNDVSFVSSDQGILEVSGSEVTGVMAGVGTITATQDGVSQSVSLLPFSATLIKIEANSLGLSLPSDGSFQLKVTAIYNNGQSRDVTESAVFTSSDDSIATVDTFGKVIAQSSGSNNITINFESEILIVENTISALTVSSIQVTPVIGEKAVGEIQQFHATALLSDNSTLDVTEVCSWLSSDTNKLEIDLSLIHI